MEFVTDINMTKWILATITLIFLLAGLALIAKKLGQQGMAKIGKNNRRMNIAEILPLDAYNKMFIIKQDDVEHIVILGQNGNTYIGSQAVDETFKEDENTDEEEPSIGFLKTIEKENKPAIEKDPANKAKKKKK